MRLVTTADIQTYAANLIGQAAENVGDLSELNDKATDLIATIDERIEYEELSGTQYEELLEAKEDCELVQSLHLIDKVASDELLATIEMDEIY